MNRSARNPRYDLASLLGRNFGGLLAAGLSSMILLIFSLLFYVLYMFSGSYGVSIGNGAVCFFAVAPGNENLFVDQYTGQRAFLFHFDPNVPVWFPHVADNGITEEVWLPCWILVIITITLCVISKSYSKRNRLLCSKCGYDRSGLPSESRCPECGHSS
jgi:hypothetical protein